MSNHVPPDEDELYQRLLPVYRANAVGYSSKLYQAFSKYWNFGKGSYSAGDAMQKALRESGIILGDISSMQDAAQEYEDAMAGMEIMKDAFQ